MICHDAPGQAAYISIGVAFSNATLACSIALSVIIGTLITWYNRMAGGTGGRKLLRPDKKVNILYDIVLIHR